MEVNTVSIYVSTLCQFFINSEYLMDTPEIIHDFVIIYIIDKISCCKIS